jgi:transcriptional regulator GlxA family with amidase domain
VRKAATGKSAHNLLDEMRVLEAKVLLKQTDLTIGEIAFKIGRFEPSDFSRFFKANTGMTPLKYRLSE